MVAERATVLITVKASPEIGRTHGETVCVAGIRLDGDDYRWIRVFPVQWQWFWQGADGGGLVTFKPDNDYNVIVFSSPDLVSGQSYGVYVGGTVIGDSPTDLYADSAYTAGELAGTTTAIRSA